MRKKKKYVEKPYGQISASINPAVIRAFRVESAHRKAQQVEPSKQSDIVEEALRSWLLANGIVKHAI